MRELAAEAGLDLDETVVALWDAGFDDVEEPTDVISGRDRARAEEAVGVPTRRDLLSIDYWQVSLGLSEQEFRALLSRLGIRVRPGSKSLPKGAVAKLKREQRSRTGQRVSTPVQKPEPQQPPAPPLEWQVLGHERPIRYLTSDQIKQIHEALVEDFAKYQDPIDPPGVRSEQLLDSAAFRAHTALGDIAKYPTAEMAGAALLHSLVHNHPFHNGNKRTGLVALLVFLDENGLMLTCTEEELFKFVLQLAQHRLVPQGWDDLADREVQETAKWIRVNSRQVEKGERPIPWRRLRRILCAYGCELEHAHGVGNRMNISRRVTRKTLLGRRKTVELRTQVYYGDEGREVEHNALNKLRRDLELDDDHGIDSKSFYESAGQVADDFIAEYRKTLKRLARL